MDSVPIMESRLQRLLVCTARVCESIVSVTPLINDLGDCSVGDFKVASFTVTNNSDLPALLLPYVESDTLAVALKDTELRIAKRESRHIQVEYVARMENTEYRRSCFLFNILNRFNSLTMEVRANNIDTHDVLLHTKYYQILPYNSRHQVQIFYDKCVFNRPNLRVFSVKNIHHESLELEFLPTSLPIHLAQGGWENENLGKNQFNDVQLFKLCCRSSSSVPPWLGNNNQSQSNTNNNQSQSNNNNQSQSNNNNDNSNNNNNNNNNNNSNSNSNKNNNINNNNNNNNNNITAQYNQSDINLTSQFTPNDTWGGFLGPKHDLDCDAPSSRIKTTIEDLKWDGVISPKIKARTVESHSTHNNLKITTSSNDNINRNIDRNMTSSARDRDKDREREKEREKNRIKERDRKRNREKNNDDDFHDLNFSISIPEYNNTSSIPVIDPRSSEYRNLNTELSISNFKNKSDEMEGNDNKMNLNQKNSNLRFIALMTHAGFPLSLFTEENQNQIPEEIQNQIPHDHKISSLSVRSNTYENVLNENDAYAGSSIGQKRGSGNGNEGGVGGYQGEEGKTKTIPLGGLENIDESSKLFVAAASTLDSDLILPRTVFCHGPMLIERLKLLKRTYQDITDEMLSIKDNHDMNNNNNNNNNNDNDKNKSNNNNNYHYNINDNDNNNNDNNSRQINNQISK